ncbi:hypothetical protein MHK_009305 [Candidatus Magnetomorum sp. HK-1]|nr:hypothetical protein MHK_009305 [Candidatus Magnetomorum sp. HK-1]
MNHLKNITSYYKNFIFILLIISAFTSCTVFDSKEQRAWKNLNQKAYMNYQRGNFYQGVQWMEKACEYATKNFGENHPDTLSSMSNLLLFYMEQGRKSELEPLFLKLISASKKTYGDNHKFTLAYMDQMAIFYIKTGQLQKALDTYKKLIESKKSVLGNTHPEIRKILINMAAIHSGLKQLDQAEKKYLEIINFKLSADKKDPPKKIIDKVMLNACVDLARLYESQNKNVLAEKQYQYLYNHYLKKNGENNEDTLKSLRNLSQFYFTTSFEEKALQLYEKGYEICLKNRSPSDPLFIIFQKNRAILRVKLKKGDMAEAPIKEAFETSLETMGQYEPNTIMLMYYLGIQHENMGRFQQAEKTFKTALDNAKSVFGTTHLMTETIENHYIDFKQKTKID